MKECIFRMQDNATILFHFSSWHFFVQNTQISAKKNCVVAQVISPGANFLRRHRLQHLRHLQRKADNTGRGHRLLKSKDSRSSFPDTMGSTADNFCLRWNDFGSTVSGAFRELREDSDFFDVTLATSDSGSRTLQAHKVILMFSI